MGPRLTKSRPHAAKQEIPYGMPRASPLSCRDVDWARSGYLHMGFFERLGLSVSLPDLARRILAAMSPEDRIGWRFDEAEGTLTNDSGSVVSLHNMFAEYRNAARTQRGDLVRKYAQIVTGVSREIPALWATAQRNVYPLLRSAFVDTWPEIGTRASGVPYERLALAFAGDLEVRLMYDFGSFMTYVKPEHLATWGQGQEDVLAHAMANLGRLEAASWRADPRGFHEIESPDSFGESMLLLRSVVSALPYADDAVFMPCNRGRLLACDGRSEAGWAAMLAEATRCARAEPWPMSGMAFRRGAEGWELAEPPASAAMLSGNLLRLHEADVYATQAEALEKHFESQGTDIFVAGYSLLQFEDAPWQSYCVWSRNVDSLLPVADSVAFVASDEDDRVLRVAWPDVVAICGSHLVETGESPARFRVTTFPTDEQLRALQQAALA